MYVYIYIYIYMYMYMAICNSIFGVLALQIRVPLKGLPSRAMAPNFENSLRPLEPSPKPALKLQDQREGRGPLSCLCIHLSIYLFIYLSIYLSVYLYIYLSIYVQRIHQYISCYVYTYSRQREGGSVYTRMCVHIITCTHR